ncbi:MAG: hypothetical protein H0V01_02765 [Bacteroidetes bacterium]|nr:hypothetical protein [Bacteroidota bacterium]HET6244732.1 hypothetical protein [Bacteroidia bacterium]
MKKKHYLFFSFCISILFLSLINSCSSARYTGLKSYQYSDISLKDEFTNRIVRPEPPLEELVILPDSLLVPKEHIVLVKNDKKNFKKPFPKQSKVEVRKSEQLNLVVKRKVKIPKPYQGPKFDRLTSTFAVNSFLIWIVGFFLIGIGAIMHIFLVLAIALVVLSIINK